MSCPAHHRIKDKRHALVQQQKTDIHLVVLDVLEDSVPDALKKLQRIPGKILQLGKIEDLVNLVQPFLGDTDQQLIQTGVVAEICAVAEKSGQQYKWLPTAQKLSNHLHVYKEFYEAAFGMVEKELNIPSYKGRIYKFVVSDSDPDFEAVVDELANSREWGGGKPVIRMNDNLKFPSMAAAERITGVPYYLIFHNCEGDIEYCEVPLTDERMEFKYASEIEESVKKDI